MLRDLCDVHEIGTQGDPMEKSLRFLADSASGWSHTTYLILSRPSDLGLSAPIHRAQRRFVSPTEGRKSEEADQNDIFRMGRKKGSLLLPQSRYGKPTLMGGRWKGGGVSPTITDIHRMRIEKLSPISQKTSMRPKKQAIDAPRKCYKRGNIW